jgi:assimilatory nitrate reductase catalytic subunit
MRHAYVKRVVASVTGSRSKKCTKTRTFIFGRSVQISGQSAEGVAETGPIVCACYSVGLEAIRRAVAEGGAANVADIGRTLRAGTNRGSCVPELQGIIKRTASVAGSRTAS